MKPHLFAKANSPSKHGAPLSYNATLLPTGFKLTRLRHRWREASEDQRGKSFFWRDGFALKALLCFRESALLLRRRGIFASEDRRLCFGIWVAETEGGQLGPVWEKNFFGGKVLYGERFHVFERALCFCGVLASEKRGGFALAPGRSGCCILSHFACGRQDRLRSARRLSRATA